ncbi:TetR family transcriptional regulator [Ralstonia wenshanensis]|uniref:TetR family transcriptional regulator n=1 Tax=Ralstonia wenshanensis TaxID=2842456 RepID=UPI002AAD8841|nr:TetR family transcriptional regulator [Ralstonia wenshanensis]MDY7508797.1 TetR family transcriptional regulator [Ralstonia wenshanensis]
MNTISRRTDTKKSLELAIKRIQEGVPKAVPTGHKLSIAAVAREAGISNSTIHNRYPDIADKIRKLAGEARTEPLDDKSSGLHEARNKLAHARKEIEQLKTDLAKSQSINLRLFKENELLRSALESTKDSIEGTRRASN